MRPIRNAFTWMMISSIIYLVFGAYCLYNKNTPDWSGAVYIALLSFPFWMPSFGRYLFLDVTWDQKIMGWFKTPKGDDKVVQFPKPELAQPVPEVTPPKAPATTYYMVGVNSENRVVFKMGYSEITMNEQGVNNLIAQLTTALATIRGEYDDADPT